MAQHQSIYAPKDWSQAKQRTNLTVYDQYGREYFGVIEIKTGDKVGIWETRFQAPLTPEDKYLERVPGRPYSLYWNIRRHINDIRAERRDWERRGHQAARKLHGQAYNPATALSSSDVLDIIGPPPQAVEPLLAALQGDLWVLGRSKKVNQKLVPFIEELNQVHVEKVRREQEPDMRGSYSAEEQRAALARPKRNRQAFERDEAEFRARLERARRNSRELDEAEGHGIRSVDEMLEADAREEWDSEYEDATGHDVVDDLEELAEPEEEPEELDFDDDPRNRGGVQPIRSNRPQARQVTRGTGSRKQKAKAPAESGGKKDSWPRFPKGHPKAGQKIPRTLLEAGA